MGVSKWIDSDGNRRVCPFEGCGRVIYAKGLCNGHYKQQAKGVDLYPLGSKRGSRENLNPDGSRKTCSAPGCKSLAVSRGKCAMHHTRDSLPDMDSLPDPPEPSVPGLCGAPGCSNRHTSRGMCEFHYAQWRRGTPFSLREGGEACPSPGCSREKSKSSEMCKRCRQIAWRYSIPVSQLKRMFDPENYSCSNVGCTETTNLHIDHSHVCCPDGKFQRSHKKSCGDCVRGWLCKGCNNSLGFLQENPRRIQGLLVYLMAGGRLNK